MSLKLMYITNNVEVAKMAQKAGVDRIWIDLETLGKEERQKGLNTVKSKHSIEDINNIAPIITSSELLVRVNPWNDNSVEEIEQVIAAGADVVMLPMWRSFDEVEAFLNVVNKRAKTTLLLETKEAVEHLDSILTLPGIDEVHIGLNDLHLAYHLDFMFEPLVNGLVENICLKLKEANIPFGFGGIARIGEGTLPAEKILMEHYRLGSSRVILSRTFCNIDKINDLGKLEPEFIENVLKIREFEHSLLETDSVVFEANRKEVAQQVAMIVKEKREGSL